MAIPCLTTGAAPAPRADIAIAPRADIALVAALIVLLALVAIPWRIAHDDPSDAARPRVEDWRGNSAALDSLR